MTSNVIKIAPQLVVNITEALQKHTPKASKHQFP